MLARLNPFRGLPNKREVWAWGMYDLANHSFSILINTVFFALYFKNHLASSPEQGKLLWGVAISIGSALVVIASPVLGAVADFTGTRKRWLFICYASCVVLTCSLAIVTPGTPGAVPISMAIFIGAFFFFSGGENFLGSFLPDIAAPKDIGRVSATGWAMGYLSTCLILPLSLLITGTHELTVPVLRGVFVFAGLWFLVMAIPTFLFLKERRAPIALPGSSHSPLALARIGFTRVFQTARDAAKYRQLLRFLLFFCIYSCGMKIVIFFSSIVAEEQFGFTQLKLVLFMLQLAVSAGLGALVVGYLHHHFGHRKTILMVLALWVASTVAAALIPKRPEYEWAFWLVGNGIGIALGGIGSASRAFVGALAPIHKAAEFFGLWGLAYNIAGIVGPYLFGFASREWSNRTALLIVSAFFVIGFIGVLFIDEQSGERVAREAEDTAAPNPATAPSPAVALPLHSEP